MPLSIVTIYSYHVVTHMHTYFIHTPCMHMHTYTHTPRYVHRYTCMNNHISLSKKKKPRCNVKSSITQGVFWPIPSVVHTYIQLHVDTHSCTHVHTYTCTHMHTHACAHIFLLSYMLSPSNKDVSIFIICTYIYDHELLDPNMCTELLGILSSKNQYV